MLKPVIVKLNSLDDEVKVEFLKSSHVGLLESFDSGEGGEEQTRFAREEAWLSHENCLSTVFVIFHRENII